MFRKYHFRSRGVCVICVERNNYTAYQLTSTVLPLPITVAALSKTWVCGRSLAEIAGSNPAGSTDTCPFLFLCMCQVEVSASCQSLVQSCPTDCGVSVCGREASTVRSPRAH